MNAYMDKLCLKDMKKKKQKEVAQSINSMYVWRGVVDNFYFSFLFSVVFCSLQMFHK